MSLLGISNHRLGYFSKVGRKQCWWPSKLPEFLGVRMRPDTVEVRFLLLTAVPGSAPYYGCTGGLWDSGSETVMGEEKSRSFQKGDVSE